MRTVRSVTGRRVTNKTDISAVPRYNHTDHTVRSTMPCTNVRLLLFLDLSYRYTEPTNARFLKEGSYQALTEGTIPMICQAGFVVKMNLPVDSPSAPRQGQLEIMRVKVCYLPVNFGGRFSRKWATPSLKSSDSRLRSNSPSAIAADSARVWNCES